MKGFEERVENGHSQAEQGSQSVQAVEQGPCFQLGNQHLGETLLTSYKQHTEAKGIMTNELQSCSKKNHNANKNTYKVLRLSNPLNILC